MNLAPQNLQQVALISNHLSYKPRNDLYIYKSTELELTFTEILNPKKINVIVGSIYRHPPYGLE